MRKKDKIYVGMFLWLFFDQMVKYIISHNMTLWDKIVVIPSFFQIHYIHNEGAAWGILGGQTIILTGISAISLILINQYLYKQQKFSKLSITAFAILMGGILGNLFDRVLHGYVIDFFSFRIFGYDFPVFNIADIGVVVGVILLAFELIRGEMHDHQKRKGKDKTRSISS